MIHHLLNHENMNEVCIYCGAKLDGTIYRDTNYVIKECSECKKTIIIRKDFNEIGNGTFESIDEKVKEETKKIFLSPRVF